MHPLRMAEAEAIGECLLELADTFGLLATVCFVSSTCRTYRWRNRQFWRRESGQAMRMSLHLFFLDGRVGRATASSPCLEDAIRMFHQARLQAAPHPDLMKSYHYLAAHEPKAPLLPPIPSAGELPCRLFAQAADVHVRQATARLEAWGELASELRLQEERILCLRSDGMVHQTAIWRAGLFHQIDERSTGRQYHIVSGKAAFHPEQLAPDGLIEAAEEKLRAYIRLTKPSLIQAPPPVPETVQWLLHAELAAPLLGAWLGSAIRSGRLPAGMPAITVAPAEDSFDYFPLHPLGFLIAPQRLLPTTASRADMAHLASFADFPVHFATEIPVLSLQPVSHPLEACRALDKFGLLTDAPLLIGEGADWFAADPNTGTFVMRPRRCALYQQGNLTRVEPVWLEGTAERWLTALTAGIGPSRQRTVGVEPMDTIALPDYLFLTLET